MARKWLLIALLALPATALAGDVTCNTEGNQMELNACARDDFKKADAELNRVYGEVRKSLEGDTLALQRLRDAQRLWVQLRDADVEARYPVPDDEDYRMHHGSIYPLLVLSARAETTRARTAWLRTHFLEREEGQL